jgi:hypothetical protein
MAYPYLPGSHTEAFKGLSVIVGLMASIGASGVVGQIASGVMIVYTYALKKGEYVRIQDYEGTVTELGLFVTRLRTGLGEEIALPNAFVLGNVTRNFSRIDGRPRLRARLTSVTIGYDTPWRQVHACCWKQRRRWPNPQGSTGLRGADAHCPTSTSSTSWWSMSIPTFRPFALESQRPARRDPGLLQSHGVQIMSPHYQRDPETPKLVPEAAWYPPPARPPE